MTSLFKNPILIYSKYCKHSKHFIDNLSQSPLIEQFHFVNVDIDPLTKNRSNDYYSLKQLLLQQYNYQLKSVPTIIVEKGEFILNGVDSFEWLKYKLNTLHNKNNLKVDHQLNVPGSNVNVNVYKNNNNKNNKNENEEYKNTPTNIKSNNKNDEELSGFNPNEMGSFSDMYSTFGLNIEDTCTDAKNQCFQFINTPQPDKGVKFDNNTSSNMGSNMGGTNRSGSSDKEKELNSRYEEMMLQRKAMDKVIKAPDRV